MRSRTDPGGWQANSVAVWPGVWSTIQTASGLTISVRQDPVDVAARDRVT